MNTMSKLRSQSLFKQESSIISGSLKCFSRENGYSVTNMLVILLYLQGPVLSIMLYIDEAVCVHIFSSMS